MISENALFFKYLCHEHSFIHRMFDAAYLLIILVSFSRKNDYVPGLPVFDAVAYRLFSVRDLNITAACFVYSGLYICDYVKRML